MNPTIICNFPNCVLREIHWHCNIQGCDHIFRYHFVHEIGCGGSVDYGGGECCNGTNEILYHSHCPVYGCKLTNIHKHCDIRPNCLIKEIHAHCSDVTCDWTYNVSQYNAYLPDFIHCHFPGCTIIYNHLHCTFPNCTDTLLHSHCNICNIYVRPNEYHQHCKYINPKESTSCTITQQHLHCEFCNMTVHYGQHHSLCYDCETCVHNYDHYHCNECKVKVNANEQHKHCSHCEKTTNHYHCKYVTSHGCFLDMPHRHCSTCGNLKEKGKKHVCQHSKTKII